MHSFLPVLLILCTLNTSFSEDRQHVNAEKEENLPIQVGSAEENDTSLPDAVIGVSVINSGLPPETLSELHDFAKNISHSKGIYRETDKEVLSDDEREIRRSILRKATVATESDAMRVILQTFNSDENKLQLLEHMEYLVHQYDVAVNFATLGGIEIITPFLFSSDDEIASYTASVLGAAMQSNPTVQKLAMKQDVGKNLLKLLTHKSPEVLSRIMFALSSFLRNVPETQEEFIAVNGISKLADMLKNNQIATNIKLKIINLFNDLAVEQETAEIYSSDRGSKKIHDLKRSFIHEMQRYEICKLIPSFLDLEDFDTHQKIVTAMISLHSLCHNDFKNELINNRFKKLIKIYDPESDDENPVYPSIDKDLKRALHNELKYLLKKINDDNANKAAEPVLKVEL